MTWTFICHKNTLVWFSNKHSKLDVQNAFLFLGACYDTMNNMIWTCSNDYIDQWCNPGNQAFHCVCQRLGVSHVITEPKGEQNPQVSVFCRAEAKCTIVTE